MENLTDEEKKVIELGEIADAECAKFGLKPARMHRMVFGNEVVQIAQRIRENQYVCAYDHRPFLPERDLPFKYLTTEEYRRGYACFKFAVAQAIQPKQIIEIGVGAGSGALAMLHAAGPECQYLGIDDNSKCRTDSWDFTAFVKEKMKQCGFNASFLIQDSMTLKEIPWGPADLFHVDGDHGYANAFNDSLLAFQSGAKWVLVDDARDINVVRGAFDALLKCQNGYEWAYFEDTWTGNLLFCRK